MSPLKPPPPVPAKSLDAAGTASPPPRAPGTVLLFTLLGIPVRLHIAFVLLLLWLTALKGAQTSPVVFLLGIVASVVLHELGHALLAQRRGYTVRDVVLHPLRGVTLIEGNLRPRDEVWIALAGPAVNAVLALLLAVVLVLTGESASLDSVSLLKMTEGHSMATRLCFANLFIALFNVIPALPLDGGKALRALLVLRSWERIGATRIAARVGLCVALLFGVVGMVNNSLVCAIVALFILFGTGEEVRAEQQRGVVVEGNVEAAMLREFGVLGVGDSLGSAFKALAAMSPQQQYFPVVHGDQVVGIVSRGALRRAVTREGESAYVSGIMSRDVVLVRLTDPLHQAMQRSPNLGYVPTLVTGDDERLVGMLTAEHIGEFLARQQPAGGQATGAPAEKQP